MKLYWRVKINGKWTWRPAKVLRKTPFGQAVVGSLILEEE